MGSRGATASGLLLVSVVGLLLLGSFALPGGTSSGPGGAPARSGHLTLSRTVLPSQTLRASIAGSGSLGASPSPRPAAGPPPQWTQLSPPTAPYPRGAPAFADSPELNETLIYGGAGINYVVDNDTWTYADGLWTNLTPGPTIAPPPMAGGMMAYDTADGYFLMFGGLTAYGGGTVDQTWAFAAGAWTNLTGTTGLTPPGRYGATMEYDPTAGSVILWGGWTLSGSLNDTWSFSGGTWSNITASVGGAPAARGWAAATYDPRASAIVMFGGATVGAYSFFSDTWELGGTSTTLHWTDITHALGPSPPVRRAASMVYDPSYGYDLLFGGDASNPLTGAWTNWGDVWALNNGTWVNITAQMVVVPPGRFDDILFFDPTAGAPVLWGGCTGIGCAAGLNDTWRFEWNLSATLTPSSSFVQVNQSVSLLGSVAGGPIVSYYVDSFGGLPPGCTSKNVTLLVCQPTAVGNYSLNFTGVAGIAWNGVVGTATSAAVKLRVVPDLTLESAASRSALDAGYPTWLNSTAGGGAGGYTYSYTGLPGGCASSNVSALLCVPTSGGSYTVQVHLKDALGETTSRTVSLTVHAPLSVAGVTSTGILDLGQSFNLTATVSGGTGPFTYEWSVVGGGCDLLDEPTISCLPTAAGTLHPAVVVNDTVLASATFDFGAIRVQPLPTVMVQASPVSGAAPLDVNFQVTVAGGIAPYSESWSFGDGFSGMSGNTSHSYAVPGTYHAELWVNDSMGRGTTAQESVLVATTPELVLTSSPTHGEVGRPTLLAATASGGEPPLEYGWSGLPPGCSGGDVPELNCTPTSAGTYTVVATVTDSYGSFVHQSISFPVAPALAASASYSVANVTSCPASETINFQTYSSGGVAPYTFNWEFGDGQGSGSSGPSHTYTFSATPPDSEAATVTVTDSLGYVVALNVSVPINATSKCGTSPLPPPAAPAQTPWAVIAVVVLAAVAVIVGVAVVVLRRRGGGSSGPGPSPPTEGDPSAPPETPPFPDEPPPP